MSSWIYKDPPPPPPPSAGLSSVHGHAQNSSNTGNDRGRGRGQKRNYRGQIRQQFQPAMSFDYPPHFAQFSNAVPTAVAPPQVSLPSRPVVSYSATPKSTAPLQCNEAGYALSSTYDAGQLNQSKSTTGPKTPISPPAIQGTNIRLDTPEDIAAWVAERRKKWPTESNIEKNKERKAQAGAQPPNKKRKGQHKAKQKRNASRDLPMITKNEVTVSDSPDSSRDVDKLPPALNARQAGAENGDTESHGPSMLSSLDVALAALKNSMDAESDAASMAAQLHEPPSDPKPEITEPVEASYNDDSSVESSSSISSDTDSSDSSEDEDDLAQLPESISSKIATLLPPIRPEANTAAAAVVMKRPCKYHRQGRCTRGDECVFFHEITKKPDGARKSTQLQRVDDRHKWRKRKSLYERLVEAEIANEQMQLEAEKGQETVSHDIEA